MSAESKVAAPVGGHTPGPWRAVVDGFPSVEATSAPHLALCNDASIPMAERLANTRLIAAAPELLEALNLVLGNCLDSEGLAAAHAKARAALAKAGGES